MKQIPKKYKMVMMPPAKVSDSPPVISKKSDLIINLVTFLAQESRWIKMNKMKMNAPVITNASPI